MVWDGAFRLVTLSCLCATGEARSFEVRVEAVADRDPEGGVWLYLAKPVAREEQGEEEYFASFKKVGPHLLQLEAVTNGLSKPYKRCGITRALLPHVAAQHSARIQSSRNRPAEEEMRSEAATRVWERMMEEGLASYDAAEDRYYFPAGGPPGPTP